MKRWLKIIIPVFALTFILLGPAVQAQAGTILSLDATPGTNEIAVSGVAEDGVLSVMIVVYDATETTVLQMQSVAVDASHAYQYTFSVEPGTYVVKAADYNGGTFASKKVTVTAATTTTATTAASTTDTTTTAASTTAVASTEKPATPGTGDNSKMYLWIALLILSGAGAIGTLVYSKRKNHA